jgi:FMN reductase (NADPH)
MDSHDLFNLIHRRASTRRFEDRPVPDDIVERLLAAGQRAPYTGQLYSVIVTADPEKRNLVSDWLGPLPRRAPLFLLFCVDFRRLDKFAVRYRRQVILGGAALLWWGIQDTTYVAENVVLAAEALGLGSCFLGGTPWYSGELCELFSIPERVFPVVGLVVGHPAEHPEPRPRIPLKFVVHQEHYHDLTEEEVTEALSVMDAGILREGYYKKYNTAFRHLKGEPELSDEDYTYGEHTSRKFGTYWDTLGRDLRENLRKQGIKL